MTPRPVVGILHPGRMGAALAVQARDNTADIRWLPQGRSEQTVHRAESAGLTPVVSLAELVAGSSILISICAPAFAVDVAQAVADQGFTGVYVEANAISPRRFTSLATALARSGATVVDGALFGPPPDPGKQVQLYLAGPAQALEAATALFAGSAVHTTALTQAAPAASALKMAHTSYQKAAHALAAVALALADQYDVSEHLINEARKNMSPLTSPDHLPRAAARAWRWAPELNDAATALADAGLPSRVLQEAAKVLDRWGGHRDEWDVPLSELLRSLEVKASSPPSLSDS